MGADYQELLAECSQPLGAISLLRRHRGYLELLPSLRRLETSLVTILLPLVSLPRPAGPTYSALPCEVALLPCDPTWQVKMDQEILLFLHRPGEDLSDLLGRWRETQTILSQPYTWVMPPQHQHMHNEGSERVYPLFVLWPATPDRIRRGLQGSGLPCVVWEERPADLSSPEAEVAPDGERT